MKFEDALHAYRAGYFIGHLQKMGINAFPNVDSEGNYTDEIAVLVPDPTREFESVTITVKVLPTDLAT